VVPNRGTLTGRPWAVTTIMLSLGAMLASFSPRTLPPPDLMDNQPNEVIVLSAMGHGSKPYNQKEQVDRVLPRTGQG
jgi:hypothetical protein